MTWLLPDPSKRSIVEELEQQTDRGAAIIGAAFVENLLRQAVESRLRGDTAIEKRAANRLFGTTGPLSPFSAKIDLGLLLGLYREEVRGDLHRIREVRNQFAHDEEPRDFAYPKISEHCAKFWLPHHLFIVATTGGSQIFPPDPRGRYILTVKLLITLLQRAIVSPHPPPDPLW
jgi:DNA-binding MltR family transcriptional regulator